MERAAEGKGMDHATTLDRGGVKEKLNRQYYDIKLQQFPNNSVSIQTEVLSKSQ